MPMNRRNTRTVHRTTFAGITETVRLLKRGPGQKQGTVTAYKLFRCRISKEQKSGQTIQGDIQSMSAVNESATWHIPRTELERVGIAYLTALDRIVRPSDNSYWQPESGQVIDVKLFRNEIDLPCTRVDPPAEE